MANRSLLRPNISSNAYHEPRSAPAYAATPATCSSFDNRELIYLSQRHLSVQGIILQPKGEIVENDTTAGQMDCEVITYLEAAGFEADCAELLAHLNRIVFPNTHLHPRRINVNAGPSSMAQIAANARAA
ncbi:hypothetical protein BDV93DRAFT_515451 [Ceratobasidium sp. AG-I]|nr:hypothetical protein BDV93DRAFT_515451 [Ceratobasidium sp. AG-I]